MKKIIAYLLFPLTMGLLSPQTSAAVISSSTACTDGYGICNFDSGSGMTSSANATLDATNYANAKTGSGAIGVEARSSNGTSGYAAASWSDVWAPMNAFVGPGFTPNIGFKYHLDGVLNPLFLDANSSEDLYMDISFNYNFWVGSSPINFNFGACYDGGPCGLGAYLNGVDISNHIIYGTNAAGDTTFSLDYYQAPAPQAWVMVGCTAPANNPYACWWPDDMSASIDIDPWGAVGDFHNNFFNTFSVELIAADEASMLVSEGGRHTTLLGGNTGGGTVPEPATVLLMGAGLAAMSAWPVKKRSVKGSALSVKKR